MHHRTPAHHDPKQVLAAIQLLHDYELDNDHEMPTHDDARIRNALINLKRLIYDG